MPKFREIYTDGSANAATKEGGWAFVELDGNNIIVQESGHVKATTSNRMELTAMINAIEYYSKLDTPDSFVFCTDSQYVQKGATQWIKSWVKSNWKNGEVMNIDLWKRYLEVSNTSLSFTIQWVRGHNGVKGNMLADALAGKAYRNIR